MCEFQNLFSWKDRTKIKEIVESNFFDLPLYHRLSIPGQNRLPLISCDMSMASKKESEDLD